MLQIIGGRLASVDTQSVLVAFHLDGYVWNATDKGSEAQTRPMARHIYHTERLNGAVSVHEVIRGNVAEPLFHQNT